MKQYTLYSIVFCISLCIGLTIVPLLLINQPEYSTTTLKLVHVIFRHGERNPDAEIYPTNPYYNEKYYREGYGQLTNEGKNTAYNLGSFLRKRYNQFLTDYWNIKYLTARSTDYDRTKMTLQLVLAGLYPPKADQQWSSIINDWQPIPYSYVAANQDKMLLSVFTCYSTFNKLINDVLNSPQLNRHKTRFEELKAIIKFNTGVEVELFQSNNWYYSIVFQEKMGFPLEPWLKSIYPEPLASATTDNYYLYSNTTRLRRLVAGYLLSNILNDTAMKINGTSDIIDRKMFLYSGHELTVAEILLSLDLADINQMPPAGSYVLFEVHEIDGIYGIMIFYSLDKNKHPIPVKLPGCDYFCPYDQFYRLVEDILPEPDDECL